MTPALSFDEAAIDRLEEARCRALIDRDLPTLAAMCAEELVYTPTSTRRDTRTSWLESVGSGYYVYLSFESSDRRIRIVGPTALVTARLRSEVIVDGVRKSLDNAILAIWIRRAEEWRFVAYQPTPVPSGMPFPPAGPKP